MSETKMTKEEKKELKRKQRKQRVKDYAKSTSSAQIERNYIVTRRIFIAFIVFAVFSFFFRPWFYTFILIVLILREKGRMQDANEAYHIKTGEWIKEPKPKKVKE